MKIRILGSGSSFGVPLLYNFNGKIDLKNPHNFRTRSSILLTVDKKKILIDTAPELRQQLIDAKISNLDYVLFTHIHSDHTAAVPDIRAFSLVNKKIIPCYMPETMKKEMIIKYKYIFKGEKQYRPFMEIKDLEYCFSLDNVKITTFPHNHGDIDCQTYIFEHSKKKFAYSTDFKKFYNNDIDKLKNLDLWILGLLRYDDHPSHAGFKEIIEHIKYVKPKKVVFTHMTAHLDEEELIDKIPKSLNALPGYDGMEIIL